MISRKSFRLLAATACATAAFGAQAQSSVTIYGLIDIALTKGSGPRPLALERGNVNTLGFRGNEDLGGDLSATFNLQTRYRLDTGAQERAAIFWQGESTVGLASKTWGRVRLGRALTSIQQLEWKFDPWQASGFNGSLSPFHFGNFTFSSDGTSDVALGSANFARSPNSIFYNSPTWGGFSFMVSGEVEKSAPAAIKRNRSVSLNYDEGPVALMYGHEQNTAGAKLDFFGGAYKFSVIELMGGYAIVEKTTGLKEHSYSLGGVWTLPSTDYVRFGYGRDKELDISKLAAGYYHPLSKRTTIYADLWRTKNPAPGASFTGTALGIVHKF